MESLNHLIGDELNRKFPVSPMAYINFRDPVAFSRIKPGWTILKWVQQLLHPLALQY